MIDDENDLTDSDAFSSVLNDWGHKCLEKGESIMFVRACCLLFGLIGFALQAQVFHLPAHVYIWDGFERNPDKRRSSYPYLSGDTFRALCDHVFDETKTFLDVDAIRPGDAVFVVADFFQYFFNEVFPHIKHPIIIVTHNRDDAVPGVYASYLDDEKIVAWFSVNIDCVHPKLHAIPIGIANGYWPHGNTAVVKKNAELSADKTILLCASYISQTHASRPHVYNCFRNVSYCYFAGQKPFEQYLQDLRSSKFVLSPRGNGPDCHRTWEALLMGAVPVVPSTTINSVYEGLPVVIVDHWQSLTQEFFEKTWHEYSQKKYELERLYADYWSDAIDNYKNFVRRS